ANPQATGILIPQIPTPRMSSHATAKKNTISKANATMNPIHHGRGCRSCSTTEPIVSLTVSNVCSPASKFVGYPSGDTFALTTEETEFAETCLDSLPFILRDLGVLCGYLSVRLRFGLHNFAR